MVAGCVWNLLLPHLAWEALYLLPHVHPIPCSHPQYSFILITGQPSASWQAGPTVQGPQTRLSLLRHCLSTYGKLTLGDGGKRKSTPLESSFASFLSYILLDTLFYIHVYFLSFVAVFLSLHPHRPRQVSLSMVREVIVKAAAVPGSW